MIPTSLAAQLRRYRRMQVPEILQQEVAQEMGYKHASAVSRMESDPELASDVFARAMAAIDKINDRNAGVTDPAAAEAT